MKKIIILAIQNGLDPVQVLIDYMIEKDSRITRREAEIIVQRYLDEEAE